MTAFVTMAILVIGGVTLWQTLQTRASSDRIQESSLIAACRSELRAEIDLADAEISRLFLSGIHAVAQEDYETLRALAELIPGALETSKSAADAYAEGVTLSRTHPVMFLESCAKENR